MYNRAHMAKKFEFSVKEMVVYSGQGVGIVNEIIKKEIDGEKLDYYVIYLAESDMTVLVPTSKTNELGIRQIVSEEQAKEALDFLSEEYEAAPIDWKARYQMNMELFKSGDIKNTAMVVKTLYKRSKIKELPIQERKLYDSSYRILQDELISALKSTKQEIERLIHAALEPYADSPVKKAVEKQVRDDDFYFEDDKDINDEDDEIDDFDDIMNEDED